MGNKILVFILILILIIAGLVYYFAFWQKEGVSEEEPELSNSATVYCLEQECQKGEEITPEEPAFEEKETPLVKDDFSLILPPGWQEVSAPPEILVMAVDTREEITDEKVKETGFRTNLSIKSDDLQKYSKEYSVEEYANSIKTSLTQLIPGIEFTREEQGAIDGNNAFFAECESTQEDIDFKTLLVFIKGENILWALSFNALKDSWLTYRDLFYQIAESFKLRFEIPD